MTLATAHANTFLRKLNAEALPEKQKLQLEMIVFNAVVEELDSPKSQFCRVEIGISGSEPAPAVKAILESRGFRFLHGQYHSYMEWRTGLLTQASN